MRFQSLLPALAFLLSVSPLVEASGFGGSCRDNQLWNHGDGWHLSSLCKRYDGSENYSQLKLSFLAHVDTDGNLRVSNRFLLIKSPFGNLIKYFG